ncbi:2589_t:CDS:1, partial [Funneliformis caledonium]
FTKSRWYKKSIDTQKINTLDVSFGIMINAESESFVNFMCGIHNNDDLNQDLEVDNMIKKRQIYGE